MSGTFEDGAALCVERRPPYLPGDVLVLRRGDDSLVSHRLLGYLPGRHGWRVLTRADRERAADAPVALHRVIGKVTGAEGQPMRCSAGQRLRSAVAFLPAAAAWARRRLFGSAAAGEAAR